MALPKQHVVYFQIYGKKMKHTVMAKSQDEAKQMVRAALQIDSVTVPDSTVNRTMDNLSQYLPKS